MKTRAISGLLIPAMLALLLAFTSPGYGAGPPSAPPSGAGSRGVEIPDWFKASFLDMREDVREASRLHRRVMLFFWQEGCSYCEELLEVGFRDPAVLSLMKAHFDAIAVDIHGSLEVTWLDGRARPEKDLAGFLGIRFTPTLLFLGEDGEAAMQLTGYYPPEKLRVALADLAKRMEAPESSSRAVSSPDVVVAAAKGDFEDTKERVSMAIENQGLVITNTAHVGEMLERTGKDLGREAPIYRKAEVYEFCSARVSRDAMEADPANIAYCPYAIAVYSPSDEPGKAYVAYRKPRPTGSARSMQALRAVGDLLDAIARDALQ